MKLLVVEDNPKIADLIERALREEGYGVDVLDDGGLALKQCLAFNYDLVILDVMLPGADGLSVCRELRGCGNDVPILVLSARAETAERILGLDAGADDYVTKPFDLPELLARVRALGRRGSVAGRILRVGPLAVDRLTRLITVNGVRVDLTPREFALVAYLVQATGRTVPRDELICKVWDRPASGSNVIDAHVKNVREKLGTFGSLIETVRGVGYRLGGGERAAFTANA